MKPWLKLAGAIALAAGVATGAAAPAMAQQPVLAAGDLVGGTYMDYMKTVYARAGVPQLIQLPLTSFDKEFALHGLAAEF